MGSAAPMSSTFTGLVQQITSEKPLLTLQLNDKFFTGLLDTGADVSIILASSRPPQWPLKTADASVEGIGGHQAPK